MNNEQFRRLIQGSATSPTSQSAQSPETPQDGGGTTTVLGSRARSSIPMTPRAVSNNKSNPTTDFAKQLAEYRQGDHGPPSKKFKSSAAPKGSKLAAGYVDRTALRHAEEADQTSQNPDPEDVDKRKRLKALEEMVMLGQMDKTTYKNLRKELGFRELREDGPQTAGLNFELLERTRRGDPTVGQETTRTDSLEMATDEFEEDFDAVLDKKAEEAVAPALKDAQVKKGTMAAPPPLTSSETQGMSRDQILRRLKASRSSSTLTKEEGNAIQELPESTLGTKFKKISGPEKKRWIETDKNGRRKEILLTTDKDGKPKRKTRWLDKEGDAEKVISQRQNASSTSGKGEILGMEIPADVLAKQQALMQQREAEEEDDDIFVGVGAEYDPLGNVGVNEESESAASDTDGEITRKDHSGKEIQGTKTGEAAPAGKPRDYFITSRSGQKETDEASTDQSPFATDPTILAALKRAAALRQSESNGNEAGSASAKGEDSGDSERRDKFLENLRKREREDAADLDLGFGESRFGDEEDEDEEIWQEGGEKKSGRKRGSKKRKGNKDSLNDVMSVLAGRSKDK